MIQISKIITSKIIAGSLLGIIRFYQIALSPMIGPSCRYLPTCSTYAQEAITIHGPWKGGLLTLRRLARCHPFAGSGLDPVPPPDNSKSKAVKDNGDARNR